MEQHSTQQTGVGFLAAAQPTTTAIAEVVSSAQAEIQSALVIAKKFPRDQNAAYLRIIAACGRRSLAEQAIYEYSRGGTSIEGPSIRLAEVLAQSWGNISFGIKERERRRGESVMVAYAWDMETNTKIEQEFTVRHWRDTKKGGHLLEDERDIYEITANQGARRLRACLLRLIPGDIVDAAVVECGKTLEKGDNKPVADRVRDLLVAFAPFSVTKEMIEAKIGHKIEAMSLTEIARFKKIYVALRDGVASREDHFDLEAASQQPSATPAPATEPATVAPKATLDDDDAIPGLEEFAQDAEWGSEPPAVSSSSSSSTGPAATAAEPTPTTYLPTPTASDMANTVIKKVEAAGRTIKDFTTYLRKAGFIEGAGVTMRNAPHQKVAHIYQNADSIIADFIKSN